MSEASSNVPLDYLPLPMGRGARGFRYLKKLRYPITWVLGLLLLEWMFGHPAVMTMDGGYLTLLGVDWGHWETDYDNLIVFLPPRETYFEWVWRLIVNLLPGSNS